MENSSNLPVLIAGTSRGAISAVFHYQLASGIAVSSPVTTGLVGTPVVVGSTVPPEAVDIPAHVLWHENDACSVSPPGPPDGSSDLVNDFSSAPGGAADFDSLTGGFSNPSIDVCEAQTFHGFLRIETTAVARTTTWMDGVVAGLPSTRPIVSAISGTTTLNTAVVITLSAFGTGPFTFTLPYTTSSLGGSVSITALGQVTYTPPAGISGFIDTFVYSATDANGGKGHNVVSITVTP